jgi:glycosyltransferase involved in cell wall biosynthesis
MGKSILEGQVAVFSVAGGYEEHRLSQPVISVIVASYNYGDYIGQALESLLAQTFGAFEAIIVDDGSADDSWRIIREFAARDIRIKTYRHPGGKNRGLRDTLLLGIRHSRGEYIAFLESDDLWNPDCLEKRLYALRAQDADAVFNQVEILQMPGARADGDSLMVAMRHEQFKGRDEAFSLAATLLVENVIPTFSCIMLKKTVLADCDFDSPVPCWLDWWLWVQVSATRKFVYVPLPLTQWRRHRNSYNAAYSPSDYWQAWRNMRAGMKKLLATYSLHLHNRLILYLPASITLWLRFLSMLRFAGIDGPLLRIYSKFGQHSK